MFPTIRSLILVSTFILLRNASSESKTGPPTTPTMGTVAPKLTEEIITGRESRRADKQSFTFSDAGFFANRGVPEPPRTSQVIKNTVGERTIQDALNIAKDVWKFNKTIPKSFTKMIKSNERVAEAVNKVFRTNFQTIATQATERNIGSFFGGDNSTLLSFPPMTLIILAATLNIPLNLNTNGVRTQLSFAFSWFFPIDNPMEHLGPALNEIGIDLSALGRKKRHAQVTGVETDENENSNLVDPYMIQGPKNRQGLYPIIETILQAASLDGRGCLLRAICETQEEPLYGYGFFGEIIEMLLSPSSERDADEDWKDYLEAEEKGVQHEGCSPYYKRCPHSMYRENGASKWF